MIPPERLFRSTINAPHGRFDRVGVSASPPKKPSGTRTKRPPQAPRPRSNERVLYPSNDRGGPADHGRYGDGAGAARSGPGGSVVHRRHSGSVTRSRYRSASPALPQSVLTRPDNVSPELLDALTASGVRIAYSDEFHRGSPASPLLAYNHTPPGGTGPPAQQDPPPKAYIRVSGRSLGAASVMLTPATAGRPPLSTASTKSTTDRRSNGPTSPPDASPPETSPPSASAVLPPRGPHRSRSMSPPLRGGPSGAGPSGAGPPGAGPPNSLQNQKIAALSEDAVKYRAKIAELSDQNASLREQLRNLEASYRKDLARRLDNCVREILERNRVEMMRQDGLWAHRLADAEDVAAAAGAEAGVQAELKREAEEREEKLQGKNGRAEAGRRSAEIFSPQTKCPIVPRHPGRCGTVGCAEHSLHR